MKNIVHLFSRDIVSDFLESRDSDAKTSANFEFMAALMMQRVYEHQWKQPTMIGFYLNEKYRSILGKTNNPAKAILFEALEKGIIENSPIDFVISTQFEKDGGIQEFQLKRFGMKGQVASTEGLINYLKGLHTKYTRVDAACLIALADCNSIDIPRVRAAIKDSTFPFLEVLLLGVVDKKAYIVGIYPQEGWSVYDLSEILH